MNDATTALLDMVREYGNARARVANETNRRAADECMARITAALNRPTVTHVTQWLDVADNTTWRESIAPGGLQQTWANKAHVTDYLSLRGACEFALILLNEAQHGPDRVRIVKRTEEVVSTFGEH